MYAIPRRPQNHIGVASWCAAALAGAAASIIAREEFLLAMDELSSEWGMKMRKGAGPPVDAAAREFVRSFGAERLGEVAKLHFKNAKRVGAL